MREDLEKQLYELGPILYQEKDLPMQQTCMCWGFECPDSWFDLLKELTITLLLSACPTMILFITDFA